MEIVVRLMGGLGNQLFQYSYATQLAEQYNNSKIQLDTRSYNKNKLRDFELLKLKLNSRTDMFDSKKTVTLYYDITRQIYRVLAYLSYHLLNKNIDFLFKFLYKAGLFYNGRGYYYPTKKINIKSIAVYGYFQDYRFFEECKETLIEEFTVKRMESKNAKEYQCKIDESNETIAISIRYGQDYKDYGWPICTKEYYHKGLQILKKRFPNSNVFIFSDEIDKVKEFGFSDKVIFIENCSPTESLTLLKSCNHFIISNSSFAWWGAYLSENNQKQIIAPASWYPNTKTTETGLYYENMELLPNFLK